LPIDDCRLPIVNCRLPIDDWNMPISCCNTTFYINICFFDYQTHGFTHPFPVIPDGERVCTIPSSIDMKILRIFELAYCG
jgi:hypothetical protein